jgi:hypothetical protein
MLPLATKSPFTHLHHVDNKDAIGLSKRLLITLCIPNVLVLPASEESWLLDSMRCRKKGI